MKRKTIDAEDEVIGFLGDGLQFFGAEHAFERGHESGQSDGEVCVVQKPAEIFESEGNALEEMRAAFVKAAETVSAKGLEDANVDVGVIVFEKSFAIDVCAFGDGIEIVIEKLLAKFGREIGFCVEEKRGEIVLQSAFAAALIIEEIRFAVAKHDVARLKVAVEEKIAVGAEKKIGEALEIVFERLLVEGNAGEAEEIVFEIVEIPDDGLAIEAGARITDGIVEIAAGFDLEFWKGFDDLR